MPLPLLVVPVTVSECSLLRALKTGQLVITLGEPSFPAAPVHSQGPRDHAGISLSETGMGATSLSVSSLQVWLPAMKAKGLEISGTFTRQGGTISMDLQLTNKALQVMTDFAIQFNRNR